jgi:hypothetical protein
MYSILLMNTYLLKINTNLIYDSINFYIITYLKAILDNNLALHTHGIV